jgi:hypothetical protein
LGHCWAALLSVKPAVPMVTAGKPSEAVRQFPLGGCQVFKEWFSYGESRLLGHIPTKALPFTHMTHRIAFRLAMGVDLDATHRSHEGG